MSIAAAVLAQFCISPEIVDQKVLRIGCVKILMIPGYLDIQSRYFLSHFIYIYIYIYWLSKYYYTIPMIQIWETFYYLWVKGFDVRKRDAQSFYDDFSICTPNTCTPVARPPRASESQPSSPEVGLNTDFFKIPKIPHALPVHDVTHTL